MTLTNFITSARITMTSERTSENPHMDSSSPMDHYKVLLRCGRSRMTVYFSKGFGHKGAHPTIAEVLDCLASDSSGFDNAPSIEEWARDYGYDGDSDDMRRARTIYRTVKRQAIRLRSFLGESAYRTLLNAERE